jgi:Icc-related predicted phosphoesterase
MQLVIFSDTHNKHKNLQLPDGDMLLFAGDMSNSGSVTECRSFIKWFKNQPHKHKILIAGNHDFIFDSDSEYRTELLDSLQDCHYLENDTIELEGIRIYGSPYTPRYGDWAFMRYSAGMGKVWTTIPDKVDIILTHTPINGYLDTTFKDDNAGCKELRNRLEQVDYKLHICGHIHEAYGYMAVNGKHMVNASISRFKTHDINPPIILDYTKLK